ncbi:MAG: hypothetical protein U0325_07655 [Polyangiales bacterium]
MTLVAASLLVTLGGASRDALLARLVRAGVCLNPAALDLFRDARFTTAPAAVTLPVRVCSIADLGLSSGGTFAEVLAAAAVAGLGPCPLELAAYLRFQHLDQPEGARGHAPTQHRAPHGSITVASCPLDDDDETPKGLYLRRIDDVPWLRGYRAGADHRWSPTDVMAFAILSAPAGSGAP